MEAFGSLIAKYQDRLYNSILRICGDREEAADLCQEAFVRVLERLETFRGQSQFYTWLFRIAVNLTISRRRRANRVRFTSLSNDPELGDGPLVEASSAPPRLAADPARQVMEGELHRRVLEAIDALDDEHRVVVVLRDIEDMDYEQIAAVLAVPVGTVKSRLHRARAMLRDKLNGVLDVKTE
jgi:RNA polymerase sigma-70 factor, ECF subfamily